MINANSGWCIVLLDLGHTKRHYKRQHLDKFRIFDTKPENYRIGAVAKDLQSTMRSV